MQCIICMKKRKKKPSKIPKTQWKEAIIVHSADEKKNVEIKKLLSLSHYFHKFILTLKTENVKVKQFLPYNVFHIDY